MMTRLQLQSDMTPTELEDEWLSLQRLYQLAQQFVEERHQPSVNAMSRDVVDRSLRVVDAWAELMHAAWVLRTIGTRSLFFDGTPMQELAGIPESLADPEW